MMIIVLIFIIFLFCYGVLLNKNFYWLKLGVHQGDPMVILGDRWPLFFRRMDVASYVSKMYRMLGKDFRYYGTYSYTTPKLHICDPELIKAIIVKDFDYFSDQTQMVDPKADPLFGTNLLALKGDEWKNMRAILSGSFTTAKIKIIFDLISDTAEKYVSFVTEQNRPEVCTEVQDLFTRYTVDVIASTSFGVEVDSLREPNNEFRKMAKEITTPNFSKYLTLVILNLSPTLFRFLKLRLFSRKMNDFFIRIVKETMENREKNNIHRPDLIQIFVDKKKSIGAAEQKNGVTETGFATTTPEHTANRKIGKDFTYQEIAAQAAIFFFAGFDSISSAMTFGAYELAVNKDVQDKLREEILLIREYCGGKITYDLLVKMKYMDLFVSEILRKWPPFVTIARECTKPYIIKRTDPTEKDVTVPKGMSVQIPLYGIHHNPKYYPEPEKFDPERFNNENISRIQPYTYLPFGHGPRSCLGSRLALIEIKILFYHLLSNFELVQIEQTQNPLQLSKDFNINIKPKNGLWLGFKKL